MGSRGGNVPGSAGILIAVLFFALAAVPAAASVPTVIVADYRVTPPVLVPGEEGIVTVVVRNTADQATLTSSYRSDTTATTTSLSINAPIESITMVGRGIEVLSGGYTRIGEIGPGQSMPFSFLVRAPREPGVYFPEVWIRVAEGKSLKYPVPVNVNSDVLVPERVRITVEKQLPGSVAPGEDFSASVVLANTGRVPASNVRVTVETQEARIVPRTPGTIHIARLGAGEQRAIAMEFSTDKKISPGLRPVTLTIEYTEPDGSTHVQREVLGVDVRGRARLDVSQVTTEPVRIREGDLFALVIRIENTGTGDAKSVDARIEVPLSGTKEAFVGKIEPGNDAPAPFVLQADRAGDIPCRLTINYEDDYGKGRVEQEIRLYVIGSGGIPAAAWVLLVLIAAGAGALWYHAKMRKGRENA